MKSILFEEAKKRGIKRFSDLTEFDQWVNDCTRKEINFILDNNKVFGVNEGDNGNYVFVEPYLLRNAKNFSVKLLFKENQRDKIAALIQNYNCSSDENFNMDLLSNFIKELFDNSCYVCVWE
jgi:hypothetical protein